MLAPDADNIDEINEMLKQCGEFFSGTNTLIILDDCAMCKDLKKRSNKFIELAFSGRHKGLSVWVLTQQLTSIAKPFRDNVACVVAFDTNDEVDTEALYKHYGHNIDAESRKYISEILDTEPYSRLCICKWKPSHWYLELPAPSSLI